MREIAKQATLEKTGARGLLTVCERVLRDFKYELPSTAIRRFSVNKQLVKNPQSALKKILQDPRSTDDSFIRDSVSRIEEHFKKAHQLKITFTPEAIETAGRQAEEAGISIDKFCELVLKDYPYGLKLIKENSSEQEFIITREAIEKPGETLSEWVKDAYRGNNVGKVEGKKE